MFGFPDSYPSIFDHPHCGSPPTKNIELKEDLTHLQSLLSHGKVDQIIEDPQLFFLAYGLAFSSCPQKTGFSATLDDHTLVITGKDHIVKRIKNFVELIRAFFLKSYPRRKTVFILCIEIVSDIFLRSPATEVDLTDWIKSDDKISSCIFRDYIHPAMKMLAKRLGARCFDVVIPNQVILTEPYTRMTQDIPTFRLEWPSEKGSQTI